MLLLKQNSSDTLFPKNQYCSRKSCAQRSYFLSQRVDFLSEALYHIDSNLKDLQKRGQELSKDEILTKIKSFPDIREALDCKLDVSSSDSNIFSQKQSQLVTTASSTISIDSLNKIYEVPVELDLNKYFDPDIYEVPIELQLEATSKDLQNLLTAFNNWSQLTPSLQKSILDLMKTDYMSSQEGASQDKNNEMEISFTENDKNQKCHLDNSFSISQVGKKCQNKSVQIQTDNQTVQKKEIEIQTDINERQLEDYRLEFKDGALKIEEWVEVDFSLQKIERVLHEIPVEMNTEKELIEFGIQTQVYDSFCGEQSEVNTILEEVDGVLGSIQQMLYELPTHHRFSDPEDYEPEVYVLQNVESPLEYEAINEKLRQEDFNDEIIEEAEDTLGKIQKILYEVPSEYKPTSSFKSLELIDQIVQTIKEKDQATLYEIPIEMEMIEDSESDESIDDQVEVEEEKQKLWEDVAVTFSNIEKLLEKKGEEVQDDKFDFSELDPSLEPELSNNEFKQYKAYDDYMENVKKFRMETEQELEGIEWEEVEGTMFKIQKMFYQLPIEILPYNYSAYKPAEQLFSIEQQSQTVFEEQIQPMESNYEEICKQKKSQIEQDWIQIDGALQNIQRALHEIPIYVNHDQIFACDDIIDNEEITHNSFLINNYDIPIDIQLESNCDSEDKISEENVIRETLGEIIEKKKPKAEGISVRINEYELPTDIQLYSYEPWDIRLTRLLEIDEQVCNETISRPKQKVLQLSGSVIDETLVPDFKVVEFFEIPYEMNIVSRINNLQLDFAITQLTIEPEVKCQVETEEREESKVSNENDSLEKYHNQQMAEISLDLNFQNLEQTPEKKMKSFNTSRNMNSSRNRSNWLEGGQSEGNLTDRSMLLRRNGMNQAFETPLPSLLIKDDSINPASYYQLLESNNELQEHLNKLMCYMNDADRQICELKENSKKQKSFIAAIKTYHERQIKSHKNQIYSYEGMISEITEKYEKESEKSEQLKKTIKELQLKIAQLQKVILQKLQMINNTNDNFEDQRCELWTTIRRLRVDFDEAETEKESIRREYDSIIEGMKVEIEIKDDELVWMRKQNEKLKYEIETQKNGMIDSKNKMTELLGRVQMVIAEENKGSELQAIYLGEYKKAQMELQKLDYMILQLKSNNEVLENQIEDLIKEKEQIIKSKDEKINRLEELVNISEQELSKKFSILPHVQNQLDFLRKQLVVVTEQGLAKDKEIMELNFALQSMRDRSVKSLSINFMGCSQDNSTTDGNNFEKGPYTKQLQEIIYEYEHIITRNQNTIKQLQEQVYDYLGEALEKQKEFQNLCEDIFDDESDWDQISGEEHDNIDEAVDKFNTGIKLYGAKRSSLNQNGISTQETLNGIGRNKNQYSQSGEDEQGAVFLNMNASSSNKSHLDKSKKLGSVKKNQTLQCSRRMIY